MIASPRPPSHGDIEALIREARARQARRRLLGAAGVAITLAIALSVYALFIGATGKTAITAKGRPQGAAGCATAGGWKLSLGPLWSELTGQHTAPIAVSRLGSNPCTLTGYPRIALLGANGHPLGFRYRHHGDLVVPGRPPRAVQVGADGSAFFLLNKYRCDIRAADAARTLEVSLPGVRGRLTLRLSHYPILDYCPAEAPSGTVAVSPIVATLSQAARFP